MTDTYTATVYELRIKRMRHKVALESPLGIELPAPSVAARIATRLFADEPTECVVVFHLTVRNKVIGFTEVARGGIASVGVKPSDVFRPVLVSGAPSLVIVHNHPSGEAAPSHEDIVFTKAVVEAGRILGINVLDHVVVAENDAYYSFTEHGLM